MSRKILAIFLDSGDTLIDEGTEVKDDSGVVLRAELIPGADELVRALKERGYRLALVADGPAGTFRNVLTQHRLYDLFDVLAISGEIGVEKPHPSMFRHALQQLNIPEDGYSRTLMVGNNLARDIKGANQMGMISVWLDWAPRRAKVPANPLEVPDYTIKMPGDLIALLNQLDPL